MKNVSAIALSSILSITAASPGWASCAPRGSFGGHWFSYWHAASGERFASELDIQATWEGISGSYENGTFSGSYINSDIRVAKGYWQRTQGSSGGSCQYGRFSFTLPNGDIVGLWSYCDDEPQWQWNARGMCDDSMLPGPFPEIQVTEKQ